MNMLRRKKRSTTVVNVMIAIVITLAVNFSYILVMIAEQRENSSNTTNNQPQQQLQQPPQHPEAEGVLHLSRDGYGYIIVKHNISQETPDEGKVDSIFVSNRRVWQYRLQDGDTIRCTLYPPRGNSNPSLNEVLIHNGNEIPAPPVYDRPRRSQDMVWQMLYYFTF